MESSRGDWSPGWQSKGRPLHWVIPTASGCLTFLEHADATEQLRESVSTAGRLCPNPSCALTQKRTRPGRTGSLTPTGLILVGQTPPSNNRGTLLPRIAVRLNYDKLKPRTLEIDHCRAALVWTADLRLKPVLVPYVVHLWIASMCEWMIDLKRPCKLGIELIITNKNAQSHHRAGKCSRNGS